MISDEQKQRLTQEQTELSERSRKLYAFIESPGFMDLDQEVRFLLELQFDAMSLYERALLQRMKLLGMT